MSGYKKRTEKIDIVVGKEELRFCIPALCLRHVTGLDAVQFPPNFNFEV